jgi:hypothetical protein
MVLFEQVADGVPIGDCESLVSRLLDPAEDCKGLQKFASKPLFMLWRSWLVVMSFRGVVVYSPPT